MRHNPFGIARLIVLSVQVNLQSLVLVAAAWNVNIAQASSQPVPAAELCLILTSLTFLTMITLGAIIWSLKINHPLLASLKFECGWSALLLIFQTAAALRATVHVVPAGSALHAPHVLLIIVAWMTVAITVLYLLGLIGAVMLHKSMFPEIWSASALDIDWFVHRELNANSIQTEDNDSWTRYLGDIESSAVRKHRFRSTSDFGVSSNPQPSINTYPEKAPWAQNIRRGVDEPFSLRSESDTASDTTFVSGKLNAALPPLPLRVETKAKPAGSRFIERFRESQITVRSSQQFTGPTTPFPSTIDDHNKPIPLPRLSEWIRADANEAARVSTRR
ncbi:hypothetical protein C8F04DRAFT_1061313 [Mycena alexandri]|uniref:Uncharacterized protein n=1 Tax=Mycena alexandri TaxID=1745969 RepID=A0AAD6XE43_9AGAR|nr:hypothetical protein C8F04DRAFT_1061313 [Mycena alexandri]